MTFTKRVYCASLPNSMALPHKWGTRAARRMVCGAGALGDMGCHTVNWPFRALKLGYPTQVEAESSGMNKEMYPKSSKIRFEFPEREGMPAVTLWWFDGGNKPPKDVTGDIENM